MAVLRIVPNLESTDPQKTGAFYEGLFGLHIVMDHGWIVTLATDRMQTPQASLASEGGDGAPVPALSIEVDNVDEVYAKAIAAGFEIARPLVVEPWGVRRFFVRDPEGRLINVLTHN